ncbi:MAG: hypothetical protein ACK4NF_04785, partial [Planctomycetota bacterium]
MLKCFTGIDEVGYGPILGPLIISFVPVITSFELEELNSHINQFLNKNSLIDIKDSKLFFKGHNKHLKLEIEMLGFLSLFYNPFTYYQDFLKAFLKNRIMWEKAVWLDPNLKIPFFSKTDLSS